MKLTEIAIEGNTPTHQNRVQLSPLDRGLNFVYGENGAGKSTLAQFLRSTFLASTGVSELTSAHAHPIPAGHASIECQQGMFRLTRVPGRSVASNASVPVRIEHLAGQTHGHVSSLEQLAGSLDDTTYNTAFNFSLRDASRLRTDLATWLHERHQVPTGPEAVVEDLDWPARQQRIAALQAQLQTTAQTIDSARVTRQRLLDEINAADETGQERLFALNAQIEQITLQRSQLNPSLLRSQLAVIEQEIRSLQAVIDAAAARVVHQPIHTPTTDGFQQLYQRLDEVDQQLHRWRLVQSDVQQQRVRLKDEMLIWNDMTLESDDHPYHNAREILVGLESRVDQAESTARRWAGTTASQIDVTQMAEDVEELCRHMRGDLYSLCQELSTQYKTIRQRAAAVELKQLRRCYHEMGENTERLIKRRANVVAEIRAIDPAGADAIERSETPFCECAKHEGYLNARRRYLGEVRPAAPQVAVVQPDSTRERQQLSDLDRQRAELVASLTRSEADHADLELRHNDLVRQRDAVLVIDLTDVRDQLARVDADLAAQHDHQRVLSQQLNTELATQHVPANPTLVQASKMLNQLTNGELTQLFLTATGGTTAHASGRTDIQVRDAAGHVQDFSNINDARQHHAYLSLALATVLAVRDTHALAPMVIDDAFTKIGPNDVDATLRVLNEFSRRHDQQILLLSQHRYLADRMPGMPVFELPPTQPVARPYTTPVRSEPVVAPRPHDGRLVSSGVVANVLPPVTADRYHTLPEPTQPAPPASNRPYPLSKYAVNPAANADPNWSIAAEIGGEQDNYRLPWSPLKQATEAHAGRQQVKPTSARAFVANQSTTPVATAVALSTLGLFGEQRLTVLAECGVTTVEQLLNIDVDRLSPAFHERDVTAQQVEAWQDQAWLLQAIPKLQVDEARLLVACGITDPQQLATLHSQQLYERVERFLASADGQRFQRSGTNGRDRYSLSTSNVQRWYASLNENRSRWQNRSPRRRSRRSRSSSRARTYNVGDYPQRQRMNHSSTEREQRESRESVRPAAMRPVVARESNHQRSRSNDSDRSRDSNRTATSASTTRSTSQSSADVRLKFYLDLSDHIEAAPSIGPKTAERFEAIGVSTVADFLRQTAESMAERLDYKRLSADVLRLWQHQTRFVCRVPNLRGHDAQLLVACDVTEPEDLASWQPESLFDVIGPFSETKEGLKIIRSGKKPDLAEVTDWIQWASHMRSLQAA